MRKNVHTVLALAVMAVAVCTVSLISYAGSSGKETSNYLKGCIVSGCGHTRRGESMYCSDHKCAVYDCTNMRATNDKYCSTHKGSTAKKKLVNGKEVKDSSGSSNNSTSGTRKKSNSSAKKKSSSSKKSQGYNAYDEGYEDIWLNDDYDWDRYWKDQDYADGVDDAMEDEDW